MLTKPAVTELRNVTLSTIVCTPAAELDTTIEPVASPTSGRVTVDT